MQRPEEKTILVVEDEPDVRLFLETVLEDAGFKVLTAGDGIEALDMIYEHKPDFISLDLILPRKSGHKLLRELKKDKELAKIPVLIVTAHARDDLGAPMMDEIFGEVALLGPGLYMEKPINPLHYIRCIQRTLGLQETPENAPSDTMKKQIEDLMRDADADKLSRALAALKKNP